MSVLVQEKMLGMFVSAVDYSIRLSLSGERQAGSVGVSSDLEERMATHDLVQFGGEKWTTLAVARIGEIVLLRLNNRYQLIPYPSQARSPVSSPPVSR